MSVINKYGVYRGGKKPPGNPPVSPLFQRPSGYETITVRQLRESLDQFNGALPVYVERVKRPLSVLHVIAADHGPAMIIQAEVPGVPSRAPDGTAESHIVAKGSHTPASRARRLAGRTLIRAMVRLGALSRDDGHGGYFVPPGWI